MLFFFTKKVVLQPLKVIEKKTSDISFDPEHPEGLNFTGFELIFTLNYFIGIL